MSDPPSGAGFDRRHFLKTIGAAGVAVPALATFGCGPDWSALGPDAVDGMGGLAFAEGGGGGVIGVSGDGRLISAPPSVQLGALESDSDVWIFQERSTFTLPSAVDVDATLPGTYTGGNLAPAQIAAGAVVTSYFIHHDRLTDGGNVAAFTFDEDIIGVIGVTGRVSATDSVLGAVGTAYPTGNGSRGVFEGSGETADVVVISADRRTISVVVNVAGPRVDQARVLTRPPLTPEQASEEVRHQIQALVAGGAISAEDAAPILKSLRQAESSFASGDVTAGVNKLGAAKNKTRAAVRSGKITAETGDAIKAAIDNIIDGATGGGGGGGGGGNGGGDPEGETGGGGGGGSGGGGAPEGE